MNILCFIFNIKFGKIYIMKIIDAEIEKAKTKIVA